MNALEFFANVSIHGGHEYYGEETTVALPSDDMDKAVYYHMWAEGDKYFYEYTTLTPRDKKYEWFFSHFKTEIESLPYEKQYEIIQRMKTIEIEFEPEISYDESTGRYHVCSDTFEKYPLYSVRGTCHMEQECKCEPVCCKVNYEPCCRDWKVGISRISRIKYPEYYEFLPELAVWMAVCPDLDAVYVMHDFSPVDNIDAELSFTFAFLLKDNKITCIKDKKEVKRLYEEYHEKYPCDTSEVEDEMNNWYDGVSKFYF